MRSATCSPVSQNAIQIRKHEHPCLVIDHSGFMIDSQLVHRVERLELQSVRRIETGMIGDLVDQSDASGSARPGNGTGC